MYVCRRLSIFKKDPSALSQPPPDGPNTGILVIQDVENEITGCFCSRGYDCTTGLPFPQNAVLKKAVIDDRKDSFLMMAIPVLNKPLSSGIYYLIDTKPWSKPGFAFTASGPKNEYMECFCFKQAHDVQSRPLDPSNMYQQFYIRNQGENYFAVKSLASDGYAPSSLRDFTKITVSPAPLNSLELDNDDASGLDHSIRRRLPEFNFPSSRHRSVAVSIGKWYCPFMFVKEKDMAVDIQMRLSMFYEMTLKQQWVKIFSCKNNSSSSDYDTSGGNYNSVSVDVDVETEVFDVDGSAETETRSTLVSEGTKWFYGLDKEGDPVGVGLDNAVIDKIYQDQRSFGWVREKGKVERVEKFQGKLGEWKEFGCYILVEKYILRRRNKKLLLTIEFRHTQRVKCQWED